MHFLLKPNAMLKSLGFISKNSLNKQKWILVLLSKVSTSKVTRNSMVKKCEPGSVMSAKFSQLAAVNARFMSYFNPVVMRKPGSNRLA